MRAQSTRTIADELRVLLDSQYNGVVARLATAIEVGEGYVVFKLDPDGLKITPLITPNPNQTVALRKKARELARLQWELGAGRFVAVVSEGEEDQLPSSLIPSDPAPTYDSNPF